MSATRTSVKAFCKKILFPGFNLGVRSRSRIDRFFLTEPKIRTLDVGCGNGYFTFLAAAKGGSVLGISFDPVLIERCNQMKACFPALSAKVEFRLMNAQGSAALAQDFDQILLLEVLEHLDDDLQVLRQMAAILRPGGILHLTTPDVRLGTWVGILDRKAQGGHCRIGYSASRLEFLLREAGLDVAYCARVGSWGSYLDYYRGLLSRAVGGGIIAEGIVFLCVYPLYLLLKLAPISEKFRIFHHLVARKPLHG